MSAHELTTDGNVFRLHTRPSVTPAEPAPVRRDLTEAQLRWLAERHPGIFRNRVQRVEKRS